MRVMCTGSAPLLPEIMSFYKLALGIHIYDVYGQTEVGPVTMSVPRDFTGNYGGIVPTTICRLRDLPEMEYFHTDKPYPRGEL